MANNLKDLIEEWEFRAGSIQIVPGAHDWKTGVDLSRKTAIEECIDDLKSTLLVMEAEEAYKACKSGTSGARTYAGDLALRIRRP